MFDISELKNNTKEFLDIDMDISFSLDDLKDTPIKNTKNIKAKGKITRLSNILYHLELNITGIMVLTCARSLTDVDYPLDVFIDKNIEDSEKLMKSNYFFKILLIFFQLCGKILYWKFHFV